MAETHATDDQLRASIKEILRTANLKELSSKKVRKMLEEEYACDFTERRQEIDEMLMNAIDNNQSEEEETEDSGVVKTESTSDGASSDEEIEDRHEVKTKKRKLDVKPKASASAGSGANADATSGSESEDDAAIARRMQAEEKSSRFRKAAVPKTRKTKTAADGAPTKRKGTSIYSKTCQLSEELSDVLGVDKMPRNEVVKQMWAIFRERKLFDPKSKQYIFCDDQLERVFKKKRIKAFGMMKYLKGHIKDVDLITS